MLLNVCLNLFLIPAYGALGATYATLITQLIAALIHFIAAHRQFNLSYDRTDALKISGFIIGSIVVIFTAIKIPVGWMTEFMISIAGCLMIAIAFKLIPISKITALIRSKAAS